MNQLFDLLVEDYEFQKPESTYDTEHRVDAHLRPFFGEMKSQKSAGPRGGSKSLAEGGTCYRQERTPRVALNVATLRPG
jgi:hypothetical protein